VSLEDGLFVFCPHCAQPLAERHAGERVRPACDGCGFVQYRNPVVGVAVIVQQDGEVLLGRRAGSYAGKWCIPCGYVEWEEDLRAAACREFLEETGLDVRLGPVYEVHSNFHNPRQHTVGVWFSAEAWEGQLRPGGDLDNVRFVALDGLPELAFPTDALVLQRLRAEQPATVPGRTR
jgi:ADP-ribose pyrophosphatase YjhB (NUDIX family)